jgi:hypothetical protein
VRAGRGRLRGGAPRARRDAVRDSAAADLRALLRAALPGVRGEFARGQAGATGGSLVSADSDRLLPALGRVSTPGCLRIFGLP